MRRPESTSIAVLGLVVAGLVGVLGGSALAQTATTPPLSPAASVPLQGAPANPATEAPTHTLTRAALADLLVGWFELPTVPYSVFPVYRDVPLTHPQYAAIDTARRQHLLLLPSDDGYFLPDQTATQLDAWLALAKLLFPKSFLTRQEVETALANAEGLDTLSIYEKKRVARLIKANILSHDAGTPYQPNTPLTKEGITATLNRLQANRQLIAKQELQTAENSNPAIPLPAGLRLMVTPSQAITAQDAQLGSQYYFQTVVPTPLPGGTLEIPADSSLRGTVVAVGDNGHAYTVAFETVVSSQSGQRFATQAETTLLLDQRAKQATVETDPARDASSLLITGVTVTVTTQAL